MAKIGILTDGTAFLPTGLKLRNVEIIQLPARLINHKDGFKLVEALSQLPTVLDWQTSVQIDFPDLQEWNTLFSDLTRRYEQVYALFHSGGLSPLVANATSGLHGIEQDRVYIIDTQTISAGLGYLVNIAATLANNAEHAEDLRRKITGMLSRVYGMFHFEGLSYLANAGYMHPDQAAVGEMLDFHSIFLLEKGRLVPARKVRSSRQIIDAFDEYLGEFLKVEELFLVHGPGFFDHELNLLRERLSQQYSHIRCTEAVLDLATASFFGPKTLGMFVIEKAG